MKLGLVVGFGIGYILGAKAGHGRYQQIKRLATKMRKHSFIGAPLDSFGEKASDIVRMGGEKVTDSIADAVKERMFGVDSSPRTVVATRIRVAESPLSDERVDRK